MKTEERKQSADTKIEKLKIQKLLMRIANFKIVPAIATGGTIGILFLVYLGASPIHIGIFTALMQISIVGQVLGLFFLPRLGKVRLGSSGYFLALFPLLGLGIIAFSGLRNLWVMWLAILLQFVFQFLINFSSTSWFPLLQDNVSSSEIGSFFSSMRQRLRMTEVTLPFLIGAFLGANPTGINFSIPFALAFFGAAIFARDIQGLPKQKPKVTETAIMVRLLKASMLKPMRSFLRFTVCWTIIISFSTIFWPVVLLSYGVSARYNMWFVSIAALGNFFFLKSWGKMVDSHGSRSVLTITITLMALMGLAWLFLPASKGNLIIWAIIFYLMWGILAGGHLLGYTKAMMASIPAAFQEEGFVLVNIFNALSGALASFLGGLTLQFLTKKELIIMGFDGRILYLALAQVVLLFVLITSRTLTGFEKETPTRRLIGEFLQNRGSVFPKI